MPNKKKFSLVFKFVNNFILGPVEGDKTPQMWSKIIFRFVIFFLNDPKR